MAVYMFIWMGLLFAAYLLAVIVGRMGKANAFDQLIAGLVGVVVRFMQFLLLGLFMRFFPREALFQWIFGFFITGILVLGFLSLPLFLSVGNRGMKERVLSYAPYFYIGFFLAGFAQAFFFFY